MAAVPSPLTMTLSFLGDPLLPEQMENVERIVEDEVLDMVSAGAREIQLDAPFEAIALLTKKEGLLEKKGLNYKES